MTQRDNSLYYLLEAMIKRGLASTGSTWIDRAVAQKNSRLPLAVAASLVLTYDALDACILKMTANN